MYKFITVARNMLSDRSPVPMYIYLNEDNNKYYISRMYPQHSLFKGTHISSDIKYYSLEYPQEISQDDIAKGYTVYWSNNWTFKL